MAIDKQDLWEVPSPPGWPIIGNIAEIDPETPLRTMMHYAEKYGPIFKFNVAGNIRYVVSTQALVNEVMDETRFFKLLSPGLVQIRDLAGDGLFTAYHGEKNWGIARRILSPAFGPMMIKGMFPEMHDLAVQLAMKWARHGPNYEIPVSDDFTRMTFDVIGLCGMGYRFNSFYNEEMDPFIPAMAEFLQEGGKRANLPAFLRGVGKESKRRHDDNIVIMRSVSEKVVRDRIEHPNDRKDLINAMLKGKDPQTGETMTEKSVVDNMVTFLIAGHETTSGLLSFALYWLIKTPYALQKAQEEVDNVIGSGPITFEHMTKLPYITAILRETLRISPSVPQFGVGSDEDRIIGGHYLIPKGSSIGVLIMKSHHDPAVYGEDADEFKPERMLDEPFNKLPPNSWKPFGNGARGCIGRPIAWQEALLALSLLIQNFNFVPCDPNYQLQLRQTLTIKPKGFRIRAIPRRPSISPTVLESLLIGAAPIPPEAKLGQSEGGVAAATGSASDNSARKLSIYYGSNMGTCEELAKILSRHAAQRGYKTLALDSLDVAKANLPKGHLTVIITASYEGQPTDNAGHFVSWLEKAAGDELKGTAYAVFGCGHSDWTQTYQRIPTLVDDLLAKNGAEKVATRGLSDVSQGNITGDFETWENDVFWPAVDKKYGTTEVKGDTLESSVEAVVTSDARSSHLRLDVQEAIVVEEKTLTGDGVPLKKHLEIQLPSDAVYTAGDYLVVLPHNLKENVQRALKLLALQWDTLLEIKANGPTMLPTGERISATDLLASYVELGQPATKQNILDLAKHTTSQDDIQALTTLASTTYKTHILTPRTSLLDLLEHFPSISPPLGAFLSMLPSMKLRSYSISSSPLTNPSHCTITFSVLSSPALSPLAGPSTTITGVASSYLSSLKPGDRLRVAIRPSNQAFHLPAALDATPIIMLAAGTGVAPFRAFVQERAELRKAGREVAPALLLYGCKDPEQDELYGGEFEAWEREGVVVRRMAYSRVPERSEGCRYVQDRLWREREEAVELWRAGAKVFVCGSRAVGEGVREVMGRIYEEEREKGRVDGDGNGGVEEWFGSIVGERFATDVFE